MFRHRRTLALVIAALLVGYAIGRPWPEHVRFVACSPDSAFRLEAVKTEWTPIAMPGQGGDGGGYVRLIDNYSHRVLRQSPYLPQVSSFSSSSIAWRERDVTVRLDAEPDTLSQDWPLRRQ
jgi:hypothetical protein